MFAPRLAVILTPGQYLFALLGYAIGRGIVGLVALLARLIIAAAHGLQVLCRKALAARRRSSAICGAANVVYFRRDHG